MQERQRFIANCSGFYSRPSLVSTTIVLLAPALIPEPERGHALEIANRMVGGFKVPYLWAVLPTAVFAAIILAGATVHGIVKLLQGRSTEDIAQADFVLTGSMWDTINACLA